MAESVPPLPSLHVIGDGMESRGAARSAALGLANIPRGAPVEFARIDFGRVRQEAADGAATRATYCVAHFPLV